jgi:VanZ family protein
MVLTALYWVVLFTMTHLPPKRLPHVPASDKVEHFSAYLVLCLMVGATLWQVVPHKRRLIPVIVFVVAALYGAFDEFTQIPVGRDAEFGDWAADISGAAVAALALFIFHQLWSRRRSRATLSDAPIGVEAA